MHLLRIGIAILICGLLSAASLAQAPSLQLPSFAHLQGKATESVDLTLGPLPLSLMALFMNDDDAESAAARRALSGLRMVRVRAYEFDSDYQYSEKDIESVRSQLNGSGWRKLVHVHDRRENEHVDVYLAMAGDQPQGLAVIVSDPREFVIVHVIGTIEIEDVAFLKKRFVDDNRAAHAARPSSGRWNAH